MVLFTGNSTDGPPQSNELRPRARRAVSARLISFICGSDRYGWGIAALLVTLLGAFFSSSPMAQTAAQRGQTLFTMTANCTTSGCHANAGQVNGANAPAVINNAIALFMGGLGPGGAALTAAQTSDITIYLATLVAEPYVAPVSATDRKSVV